MKYYLSNTNQNTGSRAIANNIEQIEKISGVSLSDVNVHQNSTKPAQLKAEAYTQGNNIYLGPGYDKHFMHEAWHVVQQKQGKVKETTQYKGVSINNEQNLEKEADIMANKSLSENSSNMENNSVGNAKPINNSTAPIQGWWPKGHRLVTNVAFDKGNFQDKFDDEAKDYLSKRSPDIDFIQDVFDTMNDGIKQTKPYLQVYKSYIEAGQLEQAQAMYEGGELNKRRPAYLLMHGEAVGYNETSAGSKNAAVTSMFVNKAVGQWQNDKKKSLSTLSDALHQSADRGSHGEGNEFLGHDVRIQLGVKGKGDIPGIGKQKWEQQDWERPLGGKLGGQDWQPDNFAVNTKGGTLGVAFVIGALGKFVNAVKEPITMHGEDEDTQRSMHAKSWLFEANSSNDLGRAMGKSGDSLGSGEKKLGKIFDENAMGLLPEIVEAEKSPENNAPENFQSLLIKGEQFYETGLSAGDIYDAAITKFKLYKKSRTDNTLKEYSSKTYYNQELKKAGRDKILVAKHIKRAYKKVFGSDLQVPDLLEKTKADDRVKIFNDAQSVFKKWNKSRARGGFKKSKRKSEAEKYYNKEVNMQESMEEKNLYDATIRSAYQSIFGEDIF